MGRLFITDERVSRLVDQLVGLYLVHGSVNKVCEELDKVSDEKTYPNRVHSLMSGKATVTVNSKTVEVIESALEKMPGWDSPTSHAHSDAVVRIRGECAEYKGMSIEEISTTMGVPVAVLAFVLGEVHSSTVWLQRVVKDLGDMKGSVMVSQREAMLPLLERMVDLGSQYIKMLKGLEES
jgi:hypothetical protein